MPKAQVHTPWSPDDSFTFSRVLGRDILGMGGNSVKDESLRAFKPRFVAKTQVDWLVDSSRCLDLTCRIPTEEL